MPSASLAVARVVHVPRHPNHVRIAALSAAIAVNLAVLLAALRPLPPATPDAGPAERAVPVRFIPPDTQPAPPPVLKVQPLTRQTHAAAVPRPAPLPPVAPPATPSDEGASPAPPVAQPTLAPADAAPVASPAPVEATLAYRMAPLSYPTVAIRQHLQGTVLLRVLVDEQGRPLEVEIERGSGYALLDRSAREQVLAGWRFEPAVVHGQPARAWAHVPVSFLLRSL